MRMPLAAPARLGAAREPEDALGVAVRLYRSPGIGRTIRRLPLAPDVLSVIKIAAGCPVTSAHGVAKTGLDAETLVRVAGLYLLVGLFGEEGDPYRTLGLARGAGAGEAQDHRNWLLKWLHPDRNRNQMLSGLSVRVIEASAAVASELSAAAAAAAALPAKEDDVAAMRRRRRFRHFWLPLPQDG